MSDMTEARSTSSAVIPNRSLIRLSGEAARPWLHDLVTTDIAALKAGEIAGGALLSPQGKILFDFLVAPIGDADLLIDIRSDIADDFVRRLTMYRLRAKVSISQPCAVVAVVSQEAGDGAMRDLRFPVPLFRRHSKDATGDALVHDTLRIRHGIAESGADYVLGDAFPHDANFDQTKSVGFRKGCYVGQEVVSRMQHRATARRRPVVLAGNGLAPGLAVMAKDGDREIALGSVGTVAGGHALAILRIDRLAETMDGGLPIMAGGNPVTATLPEGVSYRLEAGSDG